MLCDQATLKQLIYIDKTGKFVPGRTLSPSGVVNQFDRHGTLGRETFFPPFRCALERLPNDTSMPCDGPDIGMIEIM